MNHQSRFTSAVYAGSRRAHLAISILAIAGLLLGVLPPAFTPATLAQGPLPRPTPTSGVPRIPSGGVNTSSQSTFYPARGGDPVSAADGGYLFGKTFFSLAALKNAFSSH